MESDKFNYVKFREQLAQPEGCYSTYFKPSQGLPR